MRVACCCLVLCGSVVVEAADGRLFITAASGVRLRAKADTTGAEVVKLPIGTVLRELDSPGAPVTLDGKQGVWEHLAAADGKSGYMFTSVLAPYDAAHPGEAALSLWKARGTSTLTFAERTDLCNALERLGSTEKDLNTGGAVALAGVQCLKAALALIPITSKEQPYKGYLTERGEAVVYSEPAGQWFAETSHLWALVEKYSATPSAEPLAWEAASTSLPGECEGFVGCYLANAAMTDGAYLKRYPSGAHATEALTHYARLGETLKQVADLVAELAPEDCTDCTKQLDEAAALLAPVKDSKELRAAKAALQAIRAALKQPAKPALKH